MALILSLALGAGFSDAVRAQATTPPDAAKSPLLQLGPPEPAVAVETCRLVETWIRDREPIVASALPARITSLAAASITLRLDGAIVGRGIATADGGGGTEPALVLAAQQALDEFARRVPTPNDTLGDADRREMCKRLIISLELPGMPIPVDYKSYADAALALEPGLDGVMVTIAANDSKAKTPGPRSAAIFPEYMLITGTNPADALRSAVATVTGDPTLAVPGNAKGEPAALMKERGITLYRFRTIHLVQTESGQPPAPMFRGSRLVSDAEISSAEWLKSFADRLARRLITDATGGGTAGESGVPRSYVPSRDDAEEAAPALDQLLASTVLARHARLNTATAADARAAAELLFTLGTKREAREDQDVGPDPATAAGMVLAAHELGRPLPEIAKVSLRRAYAPDEGWSQSVEAPTRGLIALALVHIALDQANASEGLANRVRAEAAVRAVFRDTPWPLQVTHLPWIAWAEQEITPPGKPINSAVALRDLRDLIWKHQLRADDVPDAPDLKGGILFTRGSTPLPTAQTARPITFLAGAIADPRLTDANERLGELAKCLASVRFLRQLTLDDAAAYIAQRPGRAKWGVRTAMWDQRQTIDAQIMTLLAVDEVIRSANAMKP